VQARATVIFVVMAFTFVACGTGSSDDAATTTTAGDGEQARAGELTDQHGERYCEILGVTITAEATSAEVWGTQGLNDCPAGAFAAIDARAVATELGVTAAMPNGPRYWVLDHIVANALTGSGELREFGGVEMRSIAIVDLGKGIPDRTPYTERLVQRDTAFGFDAGRTIYELRADDGAVYVMQSYSVQIDPTLTADSLGHLGRRLQLPPGWSFGSRVLDEPLLVEDVDGVATVVQDELQNTYQLLTREERGAGNAANTSG
jgi:hypothetical protein